MVTAWADGCTWAEALQISGLSPGDLARTLSRVLDAVRQLGNLPYRPLRRDDMQMASIPGGLHPDIRRLCRQAAQAINRYPVKDPLAFGDELDEDNMSMLDLTDDAADDIANDNLKQY